MLPNNRPFLIGETAFHHQGDVDYLMQLVDAGSKAGVDSLKFHLLFDLTDYLTSDHKAFGSLGALMISKDKWRKVHELLRGASIRPIYLCNDLEALKWVNSLANDSVLAVEIHATGINDIVLLDEASRFHETVMLGSGGSTLDELSYAVTYLRNRGKSDIVLMHGFQNYPTDYRDINFARMFLLKEMFDLPIGYADHTDPSDALNVFVSCLPQSSGFNILEKHFTVSFGEKRIDSQSAVSIAQLEEIKRTQALFFAAYGGDPFKVSSAELKYGDTGPMKKALVSKRDLKKGHILGFGDIAFKRTNNSVFLKQRDIHLIVGAELLTDVAHDTPLTFENTVYQFKEGDTSQFLHK